MRKLGFSYDVVSPFAGAIERVFVKPGDNVAQGDPMFSLYVDGVTHDILSPVTGYTGNLEVSQGDIVISGMILACIIEMTK